MANHAITPTARGASLTMFLYCVWAIIKARDNFFEIVAVAEHYLIGTITLWYEPILQMVYKIMKLKKHLLWTEYIFLNCSYPLFSTVLCFYLTNKHLQTPLPSNILSYFCQTSCSHPFVECSFLYYKRVFAAMQIFKFTSSYLFWHSNCNSRKGYIWNDYFLQSTTIPECLL